jgi:predicted transcriptional regulator
MKSLVISLKNSHQVFNDIKAAFAKIEKRQMKEPHYEISFDNRRDFERFAKNIYVLSYIYAHKPKSVYKLAKVLDMDTSNLNKIILFFEKSGVIKLKEQKISGRSVRTPIVEYDRIQFNLAA